jgi:hypothetical protein
MEWTPKFVMQMVAISFLGVAGLVWIIRGDMTNAAWALGALAGYAFKNGAEKIVVAKTNEQANKEDA